MESFQWYDWMRTATAIFTCIALWRIYRRARSRWSDYTPYLRKQVWVLCGALFALVENAVERILRDSDVSFMTGVSFVIALYAFTTMLEPEEFLKKDRQVTQ